METNTETKAQKGMRTFVLVAISGVGVFLTVSAAQYGYQVWTRAKEPQEPIVPMEAVTVPTSIPSSESTEPEKSLFEPLVEKEEEASNILDYSEFVAAYGKDVPKYDFNENGLVDDDDFETFKQKYQQANQ